MLRNTLLLALIALVGCGGNGQSLVVVTVSANAPLAGVAQLNVAASAGGKTVSFPVRANNGVPMLDTHATQTFAIDIPTGVSGSIHLVADAVDGNGKNLAHGSADGTIKSGATVDVPLLLVVTAVQPGGDMGTTPAGLRADRDTLAFGPLTTMKTTPSIDVTITNEGDAETAAPAFTTSGNDLSQFVITNKCTAVLAKGDRCAVSVAFAPTSTGDKSAAFTLSDAASQITVALSGQGSAPGQLTITADAPVSGDCGASPIGSASATKATYTVKNTGNDSTGPVNPSTSDAQFVASGCGSALAPNQTCTVTVTFTPQKRGKQVSSVEVKATPNLDAADSAQGVGQAPAVFTITSATGFDLGSVPRNGSGAAVSFTAKNTGDLPSAALDHSSRSGGNASSFTIASDGCFSQPIAAGSSCTIGVQLTPQQSGPLSTTLSVNLAGNSVGSATLTGTGTPVWTQEATAVTPVGPLVAVQGSGADSVYAAGAGNSAASTVNTLLHRDATGTWTRLNAISDDIGALSISGPSNIWFADDKLLYSSPGNGTFSGDSRPGAPKISGDITVRGVFTFSTADLFASTSDDVTTTIYHYTAANGWNTESAPTGGMNFWGTGDGDMFAFGYYINGIQEFPQIIHRASDGSWKIQYTGAGFALNAGFKTSISSLFGFGTPATQLYATVASIPASPPLSAGADGVWSAIPNAPSALKQCYAVWGAGPTALLFACSNGINSFDGTTWGATPFAPSGVTFKGLWGTSATNVYAVGGDASGNGIVYHLY